MKVKLLGQIREILITEQSRADKMQVLRLVRSALMQGELAWNHQ